MKVEVCHAVALLQMKDWKDIEQMIAMESIIKAE
jgi:hypothetical protein